MEFGWKISLNTKKHYYGKSNTLRNSQVGSEPNKRFLQKTMNGINWTSQGYAHGFLDLGEAVKEQRQHENSYIIWVDRSLKSDFPCWGEVNRDYIAKTF